jgi:hypothetical protein
MSISKIITSATLAFALIGGAIVLVPTNVEAAAKKTSKFIKYPVLNPGKPKPGQPVPVGPWTRGCSDITRCARK